MGKQEEKDIAEDLEKKITKEGMNEVAGELALARVEQRKVSVSGASIEKAKSSFDSWREDFMGVAVCLLAPCIYMLTIDSFDLIDSIVFMCVLACVTAVAYFSFASQKSYIKKFVADNRNKEEEDYQMLEMIIFNNTEVFNLKAYSIVFAVIIVSHISLSLLTPFLGFSTVIFTVLTLLLVVPIRFYIKKEKVRK